VTREVYTGFWLGNLEGKRPLGRPRHREKNNIKMVLQEIGLGHGINFSFLTRIDRSVKLL
jgi:hypothetical protein